MKRFKGEFVGFLRNGDTVFGDFEISAPDDLTACRAVEKRFFEECPTATDIFIDIKELN